MGSEPRRPPPRILLVEDEPAVAEMIAYALAAEGFEPVRAATCAEGLAAVAAGGIALVVLDVGLPDGSGFDLCRGIRSRHDVPIVFLTARREEADRVLGLELGGDEYLDKSVGPRAVAAHVRAVLRRAGRSGAPTPRPPLSGVFRVDEERKTVVYRGTPLDLTPYEYLILEAMVRRPGKVFSAGELLDVVGAENSGDESARQHVKAIRRKLRAVAPEADPIRTRHGVGYELVDAP